LQRLVRLFSPKLDAPRALMNPGCKDRPLAKKQAKALNNSIKYI
jgi:hypothetical protein